LIETADVHLGGGRDDISRVHPSEGHSIDLEGAGHEERAFLQVLQEDDTLAAEATCEEDEDGSGL
jgi:hypothetical protein